MAAPLLASSTSCTQTLLLLTFWDFAAPTRCWTLSCSAAPSPTAPPTSSSPVRCSVPARFFITSALFAVVPASLGLLSPVLLEALPRLRIAGVRFSWLCTRFCVHAPLASAELLLPFPLQDSPASLFFSVVQQARRCPRSRLTSASTRSRYRIPSPCGSVFNLLARAIDLLVWCFRLDATHACFVAPLCSSAPSRSDRSAVPALWFPFSTWVCG